MEEIIKQFLKQLNKQKSISKNTEESYRRDLTKMFEYMKVSSKTALAKVRQKDIEKYIKHLNKLGRKPATISRTIASAKAFFAYLVSTDLIERMAAKVVETSCIAAVPSKDTIKIVKEGVVCDTPNRENLYIVQTPQAFNRSNLLNAYLKLDELSDEKRRTLTDDSMIMENAGKPVQIVAGEYSNIKVTTPEDLDFVKNIKKY